jgi:hypothetical protein
VSLPTCKGAAIYISRRRVEDKIFDAQSILSAHHLQSIRMPSRKFAMLRALVSQPATRPPPYPHRAIDELGYRYLQEPDSSSTRVEKQEKRDPAPARGAVNCAGQTLAANERGGRAESSIVASKNKEVTAEILASHLCEKAKRRPLAQTKILKYPAVREQTASVDISGA